MKISALRFLLLALVASTLTLNVWAQSLPGVIKAAKTVGVVTKVTGTVSVPIKDGDEIGEKDTITTAKDSSVVLVMVNGSTVNLGPESNLAIEEFQVDPFADPEPGKKVDPNAEPSKSKTTLNLTFGEMVGNVKKQKPGSAFSVKTPVGAAGIRGTTFSLKYIPGISGGFFSLATSSGAVSFVDQTGKTTPVIENKQVEVTVKVTGRGGVGGRNQQFTLACAEKIAGENIAVLSAGTDGIDGNSIAAGAIVDGTTFTRAVAVKIDPAESLAKFDASPFFEALGDAIVTGPTGNNVRDLRILLAN